MSTEQIAITEQGKKYPDEKILKPIVTPCDLPSKDEKYRMPPPGDLTKFAPYGNGVYGYQASLSRSPFTSAPPMEAVGGTIFFDNHITQDNFKALMTIFEVHKPNYPKQRKDFAVYKMTSSKPDRDGYLNQIRIIDKFGLRFLFNSLEDDEYDKFPEQPVTMTDAFWQFIEEEKERWGVYFGENRKGKESLKGLFGGDGNFMCEQLSFGFTVENDYNHVYRLWSRAWLVTK